MVDVASGDKCGQLAGIGVPYSTNLSSWESNANRRISWRFTASTQQASLMLALN